MAQVITVNGPISPDDLGVTMSHVHVLLALTVTEQGQLIGANTATEQALASKPVSMDLLGTIRRHMYLVKDNALLGNIDEMINEVMLYKMMGGDSLVELSLVGMGRDPVGLRKISRATGINVICGTGFYISASHPAFVQTASVDELCDHMVRELTVGIDKTGIRAGVIKVACSSPTTPDNPFSGNEENVLRAAAHAQAETGASVTIHPCHHRGLARHWHTYLDILQEEGANLEKCYMSHMETWCTDIDYQKSVLDRGVSVGYDQFGNDYYQAPGMGYPTDRMREEAVMKLVEAGYTNQIVLSNEVCWKISLRKYGGFGYAQVLENIVPDFRFYGVTEEQIHTMLVENPKRLLPF